MAVLLFLFKKRLSAHSTCIDSYQVRLDTSNLTQPLSKPFFECTSSEGSGDAAHKQKRVLTLADQIFNKYLQSTETSISLQSSHFLVKINCSSLISGQKQRLVAHLTCIGSYQELLDAYCGLSFYLHTFLCLCMQRRL